MSDRSDDTERRAGQSENVRREGTTTPQGEQPNPQTQRTRQPRQSSESVSDLATNKLTKSYVKFLTACFALVGAAAGLAVILVSFVGGSPLTSGLLDLASTAAPGVGVGGMMDQLYANRLAFQAINGAPLAAGVLGVGSGFYVANNVDGSDQQTYVTAALGAGIGAAVLVAIVGALASFAISPIQIPEQVQQAAGSTPTGVNSFSGAVSLVYIGGTDLAFQKLAINSAVIGVGVGVVSAGAAYVSRELSPTN
jgi:hypothetical protein